MGILISLMNLKRPLKISLSALIVFPLSFFIGNELFANQLNERFDYQQHNDNLVACGGGGGGGAASTPAAKAAKAAKQAKAKLSFKKRALSKAAAAGQDTSKLEAEIAELEATIAE